MHLAAPIAVAFLALLGPSAPGPAPEARQDKNPIVELVRGKVSDPDRPFLLLLELKAKPGGGKALEEAFAGPIAHTLREKGCVAYALSRDADDADAYLLYEHWKTLKDLEAHLRSDHTKGLLEKLPGVTEGQPKIRVHIPASSK